ncbi:MAG: helicase C-terminal domain-containing protein [Anaerolineae bacterium]|nr:exonuclease domain-containing protein [Thermoflexus sp.]MDW8064682.1 helicase C-terminal domain-containing protein [Anaerolineae bacterium]
MPLVLAALDLETTGLDPETDAILEIGVVKFRGETVLDAWSTLVRPERPIPPSVIQLTGIRPEEAERAPPLRAVLPRLRAIVGNIPLVGHSIDQDLAFLRRHGLFIENEALDTYELAAILVPYAGAHSLSTLAHNLGIPVGVVHRALDDARLTHQLFLALFQRACQLPESILEEIIRHAAHLPWPPRRFFEEALRTVQRGRFIDPSIGAQLRAKGLATPESYLATPPMRARPLRPRAQTQPLDAIKLTQLLEPGGVLSQIFPQYEHRPQQVAMLETITEAFNRGEHWMIEAGTGVGKSLAYLIPAALWALRNGERVVISTYTIPLQEQLLQKDIPILQQLISASGLADGSTLRVTLLKGRAHYLCPIRLMHLRHAGPTSIEEMRVLAKILVWLPTTQTGDGDELYLPTPVERALWSRLSADNETCTAEVCAAWGEGGCFLHRARKAAEAAHLIIVNHALLFADAATQNMVLPEYHYLIIDEAHHLEQAATKQLTVEIDRFGLLRMLQEAGSTQERRGGGLVSMLLHLGRSLPPALRNTLAGIARRLGEAVEEAQAGVDLLMSTLMALLEEIASDSGEYARKALLTDAERSRPAWAAVEQAWEFFAPRWGAVQEALNAIRATLTEWLDHGFVEVEEALGLANGLSYDFEKTRQALEATIRKPSPEMVYWLEGHTEEGNRARVGLYMAPLNVGPLVQRYLLEPKRCVIMTSATLRTVSRECQEPSFAHLKNRLGTWEMKELALDSPFDYRRNALVYLVTDIPEPGQAGYQRAVEQAIQMAAQALQGRTMALFTAYAPLRRAARALAAPLAKAGITVYEQGDGSSRQQLVERFRSTERAVLLGTRSLWEGIDIPGEALSCLVITKLPFEVPDEPVFAIRSAQYRDPFLDYAVPEAVLRFRQGFGRLIRSRSDRGVVLILDRRILTRAYGAWFLSALPPCTIHRGPLNQIETIVKAWLNHPTEQHHLYESLTGFTNR